MTNEQYNKDIIIEGKSEKTWNRLGYSISLTAQYMKYIAVLVSDKEKYDYMIHFENETSPYIPYTDTEKEKLFMALSQTLKSGDIITSEGGITPGGISAFKKFANEYGFEIIGKHSGKSVYWASKRILDINKFNEWVQKPEHANDFIIIDKTKPISLENTRPVILILKKR